jgi:hypothetical protein
MSVAVGLGWLARQDFGERVGRPLLGLIDIARSTNIARALIARWISTGVPFTGLWITGLWTSEVR